ncbi:MAG: alpha/beta hydrolase [Chloroflexota bacterium]|nr:alpha/beta hydrolase [Chloroflexota bacterium]
MKLVFIHGAGGTMDVWHYQIMHFPEADAINLPGREKGEPCSSIDEYMEWVQGYIQQYEEQDIVLVGHSMGGAIVQLFALKYPEKVRGIVLISTGAKLRVNPMFLDALKAGVQGNSAALDEAFVYSCRYLEPEVADILAEKRRLVGHSIQLNDMLCCDKFDVMDSVSRIKLPTLILCGTEDDMTLPKYSQYLANQIEGSKLMLIEGATHLVALEKPQVVNNVIAEFIGTL